MAIRKRFIYPIDVHHSTVLGYSAASKTGRRLWDELDWLHVRKDGGTHLFNPCGGEYLHVACEPDGADCRLKNRRWYRVRCSHEIGTPWRGGTVINVEIGESDGRLTWAVTVERSATILPTPTNR